MLPSLSGSCTGWGFRRHGCHMGSTRGSEKQNARGQAKRRLSATTESPVQVCPDRGSHLNSAVLRML